MTTRPSPRALLPLFLALLVAALAGGAVVMRPAAQADAAAEVQAIAAELGAALPPDATDPRALLRTAAQEDEDPDGDGLSTELEIRLGLDPEDPDTNDDGVEDGDEDSDGDGLRNRDELRETRTDPARKDTDDDGVPDGKEDPDRDGLANRFEIDRTRTDPRHEDTDRDGLHDGIEDPDRDLLSNRGEQRFGTNPNKKDSDGDRRDDWYEDSNRNGVPDGREQDKGRLPSTLTPRLSRATEDVPPTHSKPCHSRGTDTAARACTWTFGPKKGRKLVILTGDSHAAHWLPALLKVAEHRGWKLMTITKSSCPVADVLVAPGDAKARACSTWRAKAWAKIRSLNPHLVIASSLDSYAFRNGTSARSKSDGAWKTALTRSLRRLGKGRTKVLMLGDVYPWGSQRVVLACLRKYTRDLSKCQKPRSASTAAWVRRRDKVQAAAAKAAGAGFRSTRHVVCAYDPCPLVVDRILVTRDGGHLSATYSREIWRALNRMVPNL